MFSLQAQREEELQTLQENYKSVYLHPATNVCALLSAGSLLQVVDEVFAGRARAGVGIIRPPATTPSRTAPTASASTTMWPSPPTGWDAKVGAAWVLVVVWDVHPCSGIQHVFVAEPRVLYVSLHCHDHGLFFPSSEDPNYDEWGRDLAKATTLTLPSGMGDAEALTQVVLPVAFQFNPQLVLVTASLDVGAGTHLEDRIVLALEGGFNLTTISYCMTLCAKALLGDLLPPLEPQLVPNKCRADHQWRHPYPQPLLAGALLQV
ncbi:histone deacetylase 6-like [Eriocheir sinensis]|uniref:histone deacetylase 6-like n=1 Tax=Eriocheir sinensis TaxID=95602 RepID=UPI0021C6C4D3|nr:histone deacetylase 6-like [Eriocheir sinensis]